MPPPRPPPSRDAPRGLVAQADDERAGGGHVQRADAVREECVDVLAHGRLRGRGVDDKAHLDGVLLIRLLDGHVVDVEVDLAAIEEAKRLDRKRRTRVGRDVERVDARVDRDEGRGCREEGARSHARPVEPIRQGGGAESSP